MTHRPTKRAAARKPAKPAKRKTAARVRAKPQPLDDFIAAGAHSLGLTVDPDWLPAVRTHLGVTLRHGAAVADFSLPDETEPAPVFKA
jgi:hypothetical protein